MADNDKDGRLTADEFIVAMHCCDIARTGQPLPISLPDGWLPTNAVQDERKNSLPKSNETPSYAELNQQLKETIQASNNSSATEPNEPDRKPTVATYEEKRLKNYEVCSENCHLTDENKMFSLGGKSRIGTTSTITTRPRRKRTPRTRRTR